MTLSCLGQKLFLPTSQYFSCSIVLASFSLFVTSFNNTKREPRQYFPGIIRIPLSSLRAGSLSVLFARVTWSRDLRAGERSESARRMGRGKVLLADSLRLTGSQIAAPTSPRSNVGGSFFVLIRKIYSRCCQDMTKDI